MLAAALGGCTGCGGGGRPAASSLDAGLQVRLAVLRDPVVEVAFINTGNRPIWLKPFVLIDDIHITPVGAAGSVKRFCTSHEGIPDPPDDKTLPLHDPRYQLLQPNQILRQEHNLQECYEIKRPGDYLITTRWEDWHTAGLVPPAPPGAVWVKGPIESAPVKFHAQRSLLR